MKKIIATVLATVMILSILATLAIVPAAAAEETKDGGDWAVFQDPKTYQDDDGNYIYDFSDPTKSTTNVAGYEYTDDGFKISGEFSTKTLSTPRIQTTTKEMQNLKEGISMTVKVTGFEAVPGTDRWFSFYIWDQINPAQGDNSGNYGQGFACLNRVAVIQNFISDQVFYDWTNEMLQHGSEGNPCTWSLMADNTGAGGVAPNPGSMDPDADGTYTLTMRLEYDKAADYYSLYIQDVLVTPADVLNEYLHQRFTEGFAYIGFGLFNETSDVTTTVTITEFNGEKPTGSDKAEQVNNVEPIGDIIDTSEFDPKDPVLYFDAKNEKGEFKKTGDLQVSNGTCVPNNYDGSFVIYPEKEGIAAYFTIAPDNAISYNATEYPYVAVLLRNFCNCERTEDNDYECQGADAHMFDCIYYGANQQLSPSMNCRIPDVYPSEEFEDFDGNTYQLFVIDFSLFEDWSGRINFFRIDAKYTEYMLSDPETNHFDLCYMAYFRTQDAANEYAENYVNNYEPCGHEGDKIITPAVPVGCVTPGWRETEQCAVCNQYINGKAPQRVQAPGHKMEPSEYIAPTCTENGREAGEACIICGTNSSDVIKATGHTKVYANNETEHWIVCSTKGCDYSEAAVPHELNENGECTVKGCGFGCAHENTEWKVDKAATCTTNGSEIEVCKKCQFVKITKVVEAPGHKEEVLPAVEATCTDAGRTEGKKCTVCDTTLVAQNLISAKGHTPEEIPAVEATCKDTGLTAGEKCTVCGTVTVEQTETPVTTHTYDSDTDADCNVCGEKRTITTQAPTTNTPSEGGDDNGGKEEKKGCGSVIGLSAFAVIATVSLAGVVCFKKKD